jgi:hypothetical protein
MSTPSTGRSEDQEDQATTQEQLSDMFFAGTSDGSVQLEKEMITIPNTGYQEAVNTQEDEVQRLSN